MSTVDSLPERLRAKIELGENGCWLWTAAVDSCGYSRVKWEGKTQFGHRVVYRLLVGDPCDLPIDHLCRVHNCVNPRHLEPVPQRVNVNRGIAPSTTKTYYANHTECPQGHSLYGPNLYAHVTKAGYVNKQCRACRNASNRRTRGARRAARRQAAG